MNGRNYIAGDWVDAHGGATYEKTNPWRPDEVVGTYASSGEDDVAAAVSAAAAAYPAWSALPLAGRGAYLVAAAASLERRVDEIARDMSTEMGKPLREARGETLRAAQILRYAASEAFRPVGEHFEQSATGAQVSTRRRPLGVVGLITPWNFPIAIPVWKLAPALIYGNTVVLKLAFEAPRTGLHVAEAFAEAGLPPGVLNVVTGRGSTVGAALVRDRPCPRDLVHRLGRDGPRRARRGDARRQARPARAGRPQPADRDGRRRPRPRGRSRRMPAPSGRPGRSAPRHVGSTSRTASTTRSGRRSWRASTADGSATRSTRRPRSARS